MPFPDIDPVLISFDMLGRTFAVRWYALAYIAGLILGWQYVAALCRRPALWGASGAPMQAQQADDLLTWMIFGVILGGRLGYVLFYNPAHFMVHPGEIIAVWNGGMSFHGGFLGVVLAIVLFSWRNGLAQMRVGDAVAAATPIGLFFGRIANFINAELWGRPSDAPWAVAFPGDAAQTCPIDWLGPCTRHPSQLYEAALEGVVLFLVLFLALRVGALRRSGLISGLFFLGYGLARLIVEYFRQADAQFITPDNPIGHVVRFGSDWGLTMGQVLSLPMILAGLVAIYIARRAE